MRHRTVLVFVGLIALLGAAAVFAIAPAAGGDLTVRWISDTSRDNQFNHHAIGVGPQGQVIVAPVLAVSGNANLTPTSCTLVRLAPETGTVRWRTTTPPNKCFVHALSQPAIADIDGDSHLEVAVSTTEHALIVYDARTGHEEFRIPLSSYGYGQPTVGNLLPVPGPELVTSDINGGVVVTYGNGTVAWRYNLSSSVWDSPVVADVDGDNAPEVLIQTGTGPVLFSANGTVEWRHNMSALGNGVATAQADDDQALEVFVTATNTVQAFDGATGTVQWEQELFGTPNLKSIRDGDGDGTPELYIGVSDGTVRALSAATGHTEWTTEVIPTKGENLPAPVLGDVNNDGQPEVVAVTGDGTVVVLDARSGAELATYKRDVPIWTYPTLAEIDSDAAREILIRYGDGRVVALEYTTELL